MWVFVGACAARERRAGAGSAVAGLLAAVSVGAALGIFGIGCLVLAGWVCDVAVLKSFNPNGIAMKANTAVAFLLSGIALWLSQAKRRDVRWGRYVAWGSASVVAAVGLLTLFEYASGWSLGIDQLLLTDPRGPAQAAYPGRPAPNTALNLLLIGLALVLLDVETRRGRRPAQYLIVLEGIVALVALVGYLYDASSFYGPSPAANPMSLPAVAAGVIAFVGLGVARPGPGLLTFLAGESAGSIMARRFVLPVVLVPIVLDLLLLAGQRGGLYDEPVASAVHAVLQTAFFLGLVWVTAASLNRVDADRRRADEGLRRAHDELETRVQQRTAELEKTSQALAAERQRFQDVLDMLPAYLVLLSPDYRVPFANRFFEERFGRSGGKRCFEYLFHRSEPCENCETYKVLKTHAPHHWEWTGPDFRNYDIYDFPFTDVDGSPLVMEVGLDITERKRAEAELEKHRHHLEELVDERTGQLQAAHAQLQTILENVTEGLVVARLDGQLTHWNRAALEMHGFASLEEARRRLSEFVDTFELAGLDGEVWPVDQWPLARILRGEHLRNLEVRIRRVRSDWERVFSYGGTLVRDAEGRPLLAVITLSDITERKQAEETLRRLAQFPEENPNPVLRIAEDGTLVYANAGARTCLAAMGHAGDPPLPAGVQAAVAAAFRQQEAVQAELEDQHGRTYWFAAVQPRGERYVNLYGRDITERKRAEEAVRRTGEELARSNRELEQFAYVASHDLQEPLRVVSGYLQLIERRYKDRIDADANDFIHFAVDGAARMQQLISDLLDYSRVGTQGKPFAPTNLEAVLDKALVNLQAAIDESGAVVTRDPLPTVEADQLQWIRLLQNLISNAIKYRGQRRPEIHVSARQEAGRWVFSVRDNGIGIEPQYWEKIFAIFQRLHSRQKYPGTGIGLAICKRIVERHGGRIWLESQPGQGTTFYWTI